MKYQLVARRPSDNSGDVTYYNTLNEALVARAVKVLEGMTETRVSKFINAHEGYWPVKGEEDGYFTVS